MFRIEEAGNRADSVCYDGAANDSAEGSGKRSSKHQWIREGEELRHRHGARPVGRRHEYVTRAFTSELACCYERAGGLVEVDAQGKH